MTVQGQMLSDSHRGKILKKIIETHNPKNIVEIGTWKGLGSTKCILDSINENINFYSIESNKEFYNIAKENLKSYLNKFKLLHGKIIELDDILNFISTIDLSPEQNNWLSSDIKDIENCENIENLLPKKINFLLLDGGEFSTYSEWVKLKNRTEIIALDDIKCLKCKKIFEELSVDINYELFEITDEGNGFCVFIKK